MLLFLSYGADASMFTIPDGALHIFTTTGVNEQRPLPFGDLEATDVDSAIEAIRREKAYQDFRCMGQTHSKKRRINEETDLGAKRFRHDTG